MKRFVFFVAMALCISSAASAHAQDAQEDPAPAPERPVQVGPMAGLSFGRWMGVPITRVPVGLDVVVKPARWDLAIDIHAIVAPGRTENGLGAHRAEVGAGLSTAPSWIRAGAGVHLAYARLERTTLDDSFRRAFFGNIGGFGIGAHAVLEGAFHIAGTAHGTFGVRGSADAYDGGVGYEGGPFIGARF